MKTFKIIFDGDNTQKAETKVDSLSDACFLLGIAPHQILEVYIDDKLLTEDELDDMMNEFDGPSDNGPQSISEHDLIERAIDESTHELFKKVQEYFGMDGDVTPEQSIQLDQARELLRKVLIEQLKINRDYA